MPYHIKIATYGYVYHVSVTMVCDLYNSISAVVFSHLTQFSDVQDLNDPGID